MRGGGREREGKRKRGREVERKREKRPRGEEGLGKGGPLLQDQQPEDEVIAPS